MRFQIIDSFDTTLQPTQESSPLRNAPSNSRRGSPATAPDAESQKRLESRLEKNLSSPQLRELKKAALKYFDDWHDEVIVGVGKLINSADDPRMDQKRREWLAARNPPPPPYTSVSSDTDSKTPAMVADAEAKEVEEAETISMLQHVYHPIPTRLNTISKEDRVCVVSCMVLLLLSLGHYSAHSRVLLCYLTSALAMPLNVLSKEETEIARTLLLASKALSADMEAQKRRDENATSRRWKVGLAAVGGA